METVLRKAKDVVTFLDDNSGPVFLGALGILALSAYYEEDDFDEEEYIDKSTQKDQISQIKKTQTAAESLKKISEKNQNCIVQKIDPVNSNIDTELAGWALLWDILIS